MVRMLHLSERAHYTEIVNPGVTKASALERLAERLGISVADTMAIGDGGNVIYADPEKRISVGVTGTFKPRIFDRVDFIESNVIPLIE